MQEDKTSGLDAHFDIVDLTRTCYYKTASGGPAGSAGRTSPTVRGAGSHDEPGAYFTPWSVPVFTSFQQA